MKHDMITVAAALATLSACQSSPPAQPQAAASPAGFTQPYNLTAKDVVAVDAALKASAGPGVRFGAMSARRDMAGAAQVCGTIDQNKGAGMQPFVGTLSGGRFSVGRIGDGAAGSAAVRATCAGSGMTV